MSHKYSCFSWWWAHSRPKHVEKRNKHTKKICAPSWLYLQDYTGDARSTQHKIWYAHWITLRRYTIVHYYYRSLVRINSNPSTRINLPTTRPISKTQSKDNSYLYIAHLRQECHNSKFGIFELLVQKETFEDALSTGYSVITQFAKLAAGEQLCRRCTHRKL